MRFKVHRSGLQTHIQDQPRDGFAHYGISPSGPADIVAYHYGNYLVHNKINTASLEITLFGPKIEFLDAGYIAITGSKFLIQCRVCFNFARTTNYQCASQWIGRGVGSGGMSGSDLSTIYRFTLLGYLGTQAGDDIYMDHPLFFVDDTVSYSSGQTITYNFRLGAGRGSGSVSYPTLYYRNDMNTNQNYFPAQMIVTEIAG